MALIINLNYVLGNPSQAERLCIQYACDEWIATITNDLTINVNVCATDMSATGLNAMCIPGLLLNNNITRTRPLAKLNGNIQPNEQDIDLLVVMDTQTNWVLGTGVNVQVNYNQYSLATTIMHELCHGLGFLGLCNVGVVQQQNVGVYTNTNLIPILNGVVQIMNPQVVIPVHFLPGNLADNQLTPFANLFVYTDNTLQKGNPANDYTAFTTGGNGRIEVAANNISYEILSQNPFQPFTTCDHITGAQYLMNPSTIGQYYEHPDNASKNILRQIGWNIP